MRSTGLLSSVQATSDLVSQLRGGVAPYWRTISLTGTSGAASLATSLGAAHLLGAAGFASLVTGFAAGSIATPLVNLGSDRTLVRDLRSCEDEGGRRNLVIRNLKFRLSFVILLVLLLGIILPSLVASGTVAAVMLAAVWSMLQGMYPYSLFDYVHRTNTQLAIAVTERVACLGVVLALMLLPLRTSALVIAAILLASRLASLAGQYYSWYRSEVPTKSNLLAATTPSLGVSWSVVAVQMASACVGYFSQLVLAAEALHADLAAYGLAYQVVAFVVVFQSQLLRLFQRDIAESAVSRLNAKRVVRQITVMLVFTSIFGSLAYLSIWVAAANLEDSAFARMPIIAIPLLLWALFVAVGLVVTQYLIVLRLERAYLWVNVTGALLMLLASYILVPRYGAMAAGGLLLAVHGTMVVGQTLILLRGRVTWWI